MQYTAAHIMTTISSVLVLQSTNDIQRDEVSQERRAPQIKWNQSWHLAGLRIYPGEESEEVKGETYLLVLCLLQL